MPNNNRANTQPAPHAHAQTGQPAHIAQHPGQHQRPGRRKHIDWVARTVRLEFFVLVVGIALLLATVSLYLGLSSTLNPEANLIDTNKFQAVFLNGGITSGAVSYSTYFGHIVKLNDKYIVLDNVYYLTDQTSQQNGQSSNPQLTKLGCQQLHAPYDRMIINHNQVAFWENLQDSGKVVQAIQQYQKQNPNGPDCSQQTQSSGTSNSSQSTTTPQATTPSASTGSSGTSGTTTPTTSGH